MNFNKGETLEPITVVEKIEYMHAKVDLLKAIHDLERKKRIYEAVKKGEEIALKYFGPIEIASAEVKEQQQTVAELRDKVKKISTDEPWGARTE